MVWFLTSKTFLVTIYINTSLLLNQKIPLKQTGNVYINSSINAAIEMCGNFFGLLDSNFERRNLLVVSFFSAGLACIASNLCETFSNGNISKFLLL